jgi:hypothetical protein
MDEKQRKIAVWVTPWLWREFYKLFPDYGARSAFLRDCIKEAIKLGPQNSIAKRIMERNNETPHKDNR